MKFIKKLGVTCATITMMVSMTSNAGTVATETMTTALLDNYVGADGNSPSTIDAIGGSDYNIDSMTVEKTASGQVTVKVSSAFISHNTSSRYDLGDLFIMDADHYTQADQCSASDTRLGCNESSHRSTSNTVKTSNQWEYAFDLGSERDTNGVNESGELRDIAGTGHTGYINDVIQTEKLGGHRGWQVIMAQNAPDSKDTGTWNSDVGNDILTMTFNISNTTLINATQLAFRWQMTCANDIIEVVTNFKNTTSVPEPSALLLMLLAGFGLFSSRRQKV